jgi:hypothetical protein
LKVENELILLIFLAPALPKNHPRSKALETDPREPSAAGVRLRLEAADTVIET